MSTMTFLLTCCTPRRRRSVSATDPCNYVATPLDRAGALLRSGESNRSPQSAAKKFPVGQIVRSGRVLSNMAGEEEWARRIVEKELGRSVVVNDDGSRPGMYDLRIGPANAPEMAIECVGAVDQTRTETWNVGPAKGPLELPLRGDWVITLTPSARIKVIKKRIGPLLQELEDRGLSRFPVYRALRRGDSAVFEELKSLGVVSGSCFRLPGTGKVSLTMEGTGGAVDPQGTAVPGWVGHFLRDPAREDVLRKLQRSDAAERHAFIFVILGGAPWSVDYYLNFGGELDQLPTEAPNLPHPVTGVWIVGPFCQKGLRWNGSAWRRFESRGEGIEGP